MDLKIKTKNKLDFFAKMINVLSLVDPISKLRPKERELLAYFLYYNDKYKSLDIEERAAMIFHKTTRIDIQEFMKIDSQTFYNLKSQLKIKGLVNSEYLSKVFINLYYKKDFNINFIFNDGST
jgi:hypothetical protein